MVETYSSLEANLIEHRQWIAVDMLGGDGSPDARDRNLEAWLQFIKDHAVEVFQRRVGFVLAGDAQKMREETEAVFTDKLRGGKLHDLPSMVTYVQSEQQAPMDGKRDRSDNAMKLIASLQKDIPSIVASYSNGSTAANVIEHSKKLGRRIDEDRKMKPVITKELLPGVFFGDNGALVTHDAESYSDMYRTLRSTSGLADPTVMLLPDDDNEPDSIRDQIGSGTVFQDFDAWAFTGLRADDWSPEIMLANGFEGNVFLKLAEVFVKEKRQLLSTRTRLQKIAGRVKALEFSEEGWQIPEGIGLEGSWGILSNGTEAGKGTKALNKLREESGMSFVEPEDLVDNKHLKVLATPACVQMVESFADISLWEKFPRLYKLMKAAKKVSPIAHIEHLDGGDAWVGHGSARVADTVKNFRALLEHYALKV